MLARSGLGSTNFYDPGVRDRRAERRALRELLSGRCFICEMLAGNPDFRHHVVYEDDTTVAFLQRFQTLRGYVLVAPKEHREGVTADFSLDEYLRLHAVIHRVSEAIRRVTPTERLYILSLGSQQANSHVHWHIAALPPGVPLAQQQFAALEADWSLDLGDEEMEELATRIRAAL
jgi:diadenosine tetraphosphate (Ap4A) HIT family hydrolase